MLVSKAFGQRKYGWREGTVTFNGHVDWSGRASTRMRKPNETTAIKSSIRKALFVLGRWQAFALVDISFPVDTVSADSPIALDITKSPRNVKLIIFRLKGKFWWMMKRRALWTFRKDVTVEVECNERYRSHKYVKAAWEEEERRWPTTSTMMGVDSLNLCQVVVSHKSKEPYGFL